MNDLIMGAISGYDYAEAHVFLASLERIGFDGDVVLFSSQLRGEPRRYRLRVHYVPFLTNGLMVHDQRFMLALEFLSRNPHWGNVMIADVRDVVFQSDPFKWIVPFSIVFSLEDMVDTIRSCRFNSYWIMETFGQYVFNELAHNPISCCGVTFGNCNGMLQYFRLMNAFIYPGRRGPPVGVDTAAHNFIIGRRLVSGQVFANERGPVLTTGKMKNVRFENGRFLNADGRPPAVVHQYDRQADLAARIQDMYAR
jgi:hypothetical protein